MKTNGWHNRFWKYYLHTSNFYKTYANPQEIRHIRYYQRHSNNSFQLAAKKNYTSLILITLGYKLIRMTARNKIYRAKHSTRWHIFSWTEKKIPLVASIEWFKWGGEDPVVVCGRCRRRMMMIMMTRKEKGVLANNSFRWSCLSKLLSRTLPAQL